MDDFISRQAALDALKDISVEVEDGDGFQYAKWRDYICNLPSVQPENMQLSEESTTFDCISRQAAIDKLSERQRTMIYCFGFENDMIKIMDIAKSIIIAMPSAQLAPCDVCRFSPPSSGDEKPCTVCPAEGR